MLILLYDKYISNIIYNNQVKMKNKIVNINFNKLILPIKRLNFDNIYTTRLILIYN